MYLRHVLISGFVVFLTVMVFGVANANVFSPAPETYEQKLERGIEYFYQTDWDNASSVFRELKVMNESDPRAYFFYSMIPFWEYFFGGNSSDAALDFLDRSKVAMEKSSFQLKNNPHDTTMVLMLSGLHGYRSLVAASEKDYQTALQSGIKGFNYTRQLLALDDKDPKALIGKGIFYYMVGTVPKELQWATNMMGMKGNKKEGLAILEEAAISNSYVSNDAKMILSFLYKKEEEYDKALRHVMDLCKRYEQNIIFQFSYAEILEKKNRLEEAKRVYKAIVLLENKHLDVLKALSRDKLRNL